MSKKTYKRIVITLIILLVAPLSFTMCSILQFKSEPNWFTEEIKGGEYVVKGWKFTDLFISQSDYEIVIINCKNNKEYTIKGNICIGPKYQDNCKIEYNDEYIKLSLFNWDDDHTVLGVYRFYYEDYE